ncbi:serine hydrolase domain-containing protein [Caulobacter sp. ErkDOM-E]|uniref:serine hydrolase domain-containing protein n=1 Tax=Caulobacter sp. ErkDOM-E TaxID=3402778 RepID=UPI003AF6C7A5
MTSRFSSRAALIAVMIGFLASASFAQAQDVAPAPPSEPAATLAVEGPRPYASQQRRARPRPVSPRRAEAAPVIAPSAPIARPVAGVTPLPAAELEAFVDGLIRRSMIEDHIAGVTIAVVQNGQVVLKKGYGVASLKERRAVDPDKTLFRIASISKTFTWIALMNEIEAGRMRLDGPVNLYLPEPLQVRGKDKAPVLLRHLMTHTPGFEDRALGQLFEQDWKRVRPLNEYLRQERPRRVREPGALPAYSNYGVALAGAAVANVTGKPFEQLVAEEIIFPAGMTHTTFRDARPWRDDLPAPMTAALAAERSAGFRWTQLGWREQPPELTGQVAPAGGGSSTAADMSRYMMLLLGNGTLDGKTIYSPRTAQTFRTLMYQPAPEAAGWNAGFQDIALPGGRRGYGHNGATLWFFSNMVVVPDLGLGVFIAVNTDTGAELPSVVPTAIIERFYAPPPAVPTLRPLSPDAARIYEGDYLGTRRAYGGLEGFIGRITQRAEVRVTPDGQLAVLSDGRSTLWNATEKPGVFQASDSAKTLVFETVGGRGSRFYPSPGFSAFERITFPMGAGLLIWIVALSAFAAIATLAGVFMRDRRETRQTPTQTRANLLQTTQATLWLIALSCVGVFAANSGDIAWVFYGWPSGWLVTASACTLVASVLTVVTLVMAPVVWRGGRRVDSWTTLRKLAFTYTALLYAVLGVLLMLWNFLLPVKG